LKIKFLIATLIVLVFLSGTAVAVYRAYWFEPSEDSIYTTTIGVAGPGVDRIRLNYFGDTSEIRSVHTDLRVWFAVSTSTRPVDLWEPA
jgi:hypothetical protein